MYNEEELAAGKNEITKLEHDKKKQYVCFLFHSLPLLQIAVQFEKLKNVMTFVSELILFFYLPGAFSTVAESKLQ